MASKAYFRVKETSGIKNKISSIFFYFLDVFIRMNVHYIICTKMCDCRKKARMTFTFESVT